MVDDDRYWLPRWPWVPSPVRRFAQTGAYYARCAAYCAAWPFRWLRFRVAKWRALRRDGWLCSVCRRPNTRTVIVVPIYELARTRYLVTKCRPCQAADNRRSVAAWQALLQRTFTEPEAP